MLSSSLQYPVHPWLVRLVTLVLAALAAASVGYWVLKWPAPASTLRPVSSVPMASPVDANQIARLLGARPVADMVSGAVLPPSASAGYKLLGVIAHGTQGGRALMAIDGQPAKPYRVGDRVTDGLVLQSVKARSVSLGADLRSTAGITLELPPLPGVPSQ